MTRVLVSVGALALLTVGPALAGQIDLSTCTRSKFQAADKDEVSIIQAWLGGHYREEDDPAVIDTAEFVANAKKLGQSCSKNPQIGLIIATDKLLQKKT